MGTKQIEMQLSKLSGAELFAWIKGLIVERNKARNAHSLDPHHRVAKPKAVADLEDRIEDLALRDQVMAWR